MKRAYLRVLLAALTTIACGNAMAGLLVVSGGRGGSQAGGGGGEPSSFACEDIHVAASLSQADVQSALNAADADDCVEFPAGSATWTSGVSLSVPQNLNIYGAGDRDTVGGGDATVITDNIASTSTPIFGFTYNSDDGYFRFSGVTIRSGTGSIKESTGMLAIGGTGENFIVEFNHFDNVGSVNHKFMYLSGYVEGVIAENLLGAGGNLSWIHVVNGGTNGAGDNGDTRWDDDTNFGSSDFVVIETNIIQGDEANDPVNQRPNHVVQDCHTGGKHVTRYNTIVNGGAGQTHPTVHGTDDRGCRAHEIYGNVASFTGNPATDQASFAFEYNNSGPAMIWGNDMGDQAYSSFFYFNNCRASSTHAADCEYGGVWGYCNADAPWDGNEDATGYPCIDQPGRGKGDLLNGDFPSKVNVAFGVAAWPRQLSEPVYIFGNTGTRYTGSGGSIIANNDSTRIAEDRDFFIDDQGSFTGASGIGTGARGSRPGTCTTGVGYWSTDQGGDWDKTNGNANDGTLDVCAATDTWTNGVYTPREYPDPRRALGLE